MGRASRSFYLAAFALLGGLHASNAHTQKAPLQGPESCAIDPQAIVSDACASYSTLDSLNSDLRPLLSSLTQTTDFFSYYRLNLYNKVCPFWSDEDGMCGNIACAVNTIENEEDIPLTWRAEELGKLQGPKAHHPSRKVQQERQESPLQGELGDDVGESCVVEYDDECDERDYCVPEDESATAKGDYVSLVDNPERFTGYSGPGAQQVWEAIYRENCFSKEPTPKQSFSQSTQPLGMNGPRGEAAQGLRNVMRQHERQQSLASTGSLDEMFELDDECLEKRVFYRIISGMHASITTHLCYDYLNKTTGEWGPNPECYRQRLLGHPERISNLYFNYALVLRAVAKLRGSLGAYTFCSGDAAQDRATKLKVLALADRIASAPTIYDESLMFAGGATDLALKEDFRNRFRNVSRTMDCVGCDKCRLWGKLQTAGYGTALKVLFESDGGAAPTDPALRRTELVALVNTLDRLSHSLDAVSRFEAALLGPQHVHDLDLDAPDRKTCSPPEWTAAEAFWSELDLVWRTYMWVLRRWWEMPRDLFTIAAAEITRLFRYWLGLSVLPRSWEFHAPTPDEL